MAAVKLRLRIAELSTTERGYTRDVADHFVSGLSSREDWSRQIVADRPHVLIYQNAGVGKSVIDLAMLRLAPVQCAAWGNPMTTGLSTIDYFLSSELAEPVNAESHYTEQLVRLPNLGSYYIPLPVRATPTSPTDLGLREDATLFLCVQLLYKYLPQFDDVFPRIAREVPDAQFVFSCSVTPQLFTRFKRRLGRAFAAHGLRMDDYVTFLPYLPLSTYQNLCLLADVYLDSMVFNGCVSTMDSAVAFSIPIVTLPGEFLRGRQGYAMLTLLGVPETIATDVDDYVAIAAQLGNDKRYRQRIAERMAHNKHLLYEDTQAITGLEEFLEDAVHSALITRTA